MNIKALVYDLEIVKAIQGKKETRIPGIEYCEGWNDHANMGISVMGAYQYWDDRYRVFFDDNKDEFFDAVSEAEVLVTFNGIGFDDRVITACWGPMVSREGSPQIVYDVLAEQWQAHGLSRNFTYPSHAGFSLDLTCAANGLPPKSGNGALAPVLWQQGKRGAVVDYCLNDVRVTKFLFDKILARERIRSPKILGTSVSFRHPEDFE